MNLPLRPEVEEAFAAALELPATEQQAFLAASSPRTRSCAPKSNPCSAPIERPVSFSAGSFVPAKESCAILRFNHVVMI
jgi:hypothetical protein